MVVFKNSKKFSKNLKKFLIRIQLEDFLVYKIPIEEIASVNRTIITSKGKKLLKG